MDTSSFNPMGMQTLLSHEQQQRSTPSTSETTSTNGHARRITIALQKYPGEMSFGMTMMHKPSASASDYPWVSSVFEGLPVARAGIQTGWTIFRVNGVDCGGRTVSDVASMFRNHLQVLLELGPSRQNQQNQTGPDQHPSVPPPIYHNTMAHSHIHTAPVSTAAYTMVPNYSTTYAMQTPAINGMFAASAPMLPNVPQYAVSSQPLVYSQPMAYNASRMPQPYTYPYQQTPPQYAPIPRPVYLGNYSHPMPHSTAAPVTYVSVAPPPPAPVSAVKVHTPVATTLPTLAPVRPPTPTVVSPAPQGTATMAAPTHVPSTTPTQAQPRANDVSTKTTTPPTAPQPSANAASVSTPTTSAPQPTASTVSAIPTPPTAATQPTPTVPSRPTPTVVNPPTQAAPPAPPPPVNPPTPVQTTAPPTTNPPPVQQPTPAPQRSAGKKRRRTEPTPSSVALSLAQAAAPSVPANGSAAASTTGGKRRGRPRKRKPTPAPVVAEFWDSDDAVFFTGSDNEVEEVPPPPASGRRQSSRQAESGGRARRSLTVSRLMTMGFTQEDAEASVEACGQDPDKCMLWIVAHIEERQFLSDLNKASIESEQQKRLEAQEQKKMETETLQQATTTFTSLFPTSYILSDDAQAPNLHTLLGSTIGSISADTLMRSLVTKLLTVEGKAIRWYKQAARCYMLQLAARLEAAFADHDVLHCCAKTLATQAASEACGFVQALFDEERALTTALFSMPENHGGVPLEFLHADESMQFSLDDDGFEVVEMSQPPSSSPSHD